MHFGPEDDAGVSSQHTQSPAPGVAIERFEPECDGDGARMNVYSNGDYVRYSDHIATLQAKAAAVKPVGEVLEGAAMAIMYDVLSPGTKLYTAAPPPVVEQPQGVTDADVDAAHNTLSPVLHIDIRHSTKVAAIRSTLEAFAKGRLGTGAVPASQEAEPVCYVGAEFYRDMLRPDFGSATGVAVSKKSNGEDVALYSTPPSAALATPSPTQAEPTNDPLPCPNCDGEGSVMVPSDNGPDAYDVPIACPHCGGKQTLEDAYQGVVKLLEREQNAHQKTYSIIWGHYSAVQGKALQRQIERIAENVKPQHIDWVRDRLNDLAQSAAGYLATGAAEGAEPTDAERLDFLDAMGAGWIARHSVTGRGYRLHQDRDGSHPTARASIDAAIRAAQKG